MPYNLSRVAHQLLQMDELSRKDTSEKKGRWEKKRKWEPEKRQKQPPFKWTTQKEELLKKVYYQTTLEECGDLLGCHAHTVKKKATELGMSKGRKWGTSAKKQQIRNPDQNLVSI